MPLITIIVATDLDDGIGYSGQLPWPKIPEDMARFRDRTMGDVVIMGRKTYDSIGRPLPGRTNVVLTKNEWFNPKGVITVGSMDEALSHNEVYNRPAWIIGGQKVYALGLRHAHAIERTLVLDRFKCDTFFPDVPLGRWKESWRGERVTSKSGLQFRVTTYVREDEPG